eukprot:173712_1
MADELSRNLKHWSLIKLSRKNKWNSQFVSKHFKNQKKISTWRHYTHKKRYKKATRKKSRHNLQHHKYDILTTIYSNNYAAKRRIECMTVQQYMKPSICDIDQCTGQLSQTGCCKYCYNCCEDCKLEELWQTPPSCDYSNYIGYSDYKKKKMKATLLNSNMQQELHKIYLVGRHQLNLSPHRYGKRIFGWSSPTKSISTISHGVTRKQKESLIFGYCRNIHNVFIPFDLILVCLKLFDNTIYWTIEGDQLHKFYQCKNRSYLSGPQFTIYDVEFQNTLCPNGWYAQDIGFVNFFIELKLLPHFVKHIAIEYILYCEEINCWYKRGIVYHNQYKKAHGWGAYCAAFAKFKQRNYKSIHFGCSIDVIHVEYNDSNRNNIFTPILTIKDACFTWNINGILFNKFKNALSDKLFYSESFCNKCFCLMCKPYGSKTDGSCNTVSLALRLLRLPFKQKSITIKYTISNCNGFYKNAHTFEMNNRWKHLPIKLFSSDKLRTMRSLSFTVRVSVPYSTYNLELDKPKQIT